MTRCISVGLLIGFVVGTLPVPSVAQYPAPNPVCVALSGSGIIRVPPLALAEPVMIPKLAGRPWLGQVVPTSAPISGADEVTYIWRLLTPRSMPKGVWLYYHEHQDPSPYTSRFMLTGFLGVVEASWHSGYTIVNATNQEVVLEVRYATWAEGPGSCR
jgi:hypothetical protein